MVKRMRMVKTYECNPWTPPSTWAETVRFSNFKSPEYISSLWRSKREHIDRKILKNPSFFFFSLSFRKRERKKRKVLKHTSTYQVIWLPCPDIHTGSQSQGMERIDGCFLCPQCYHWLLEPLWLVLGHWEEDSLNSVLKVSKMSSKYQIPHPTK